MATKPKPKSKKSTPKSKSRSSKPAPAAARRTGSSTRTRPSGFLTPPKHATFWAAIILGAVGLIAQIVYLAKWLSYSWLSPLAFWATVVGLVVLVLGLLIKGF